MTIYVSDGPTVPTTEISEAADLCRRGPCLDLDRDPCGVSIRQSFRYAGTTGISSMGGREGTSAGLEAL